MSRLRLTLDAMPLLAERTGIGRYTDQLAQALLARDDVELTLAVATRPGRASAEDVRARYGPLGARVSRTLVPGRLLQAAWHLANRPLAETSFGEADVFHSPNFIAPPSRRAAVVTTVHDLSPIRFPEWHPPKRRAIARALPGSMARTDLVLADSEATARDVREHLAVPAERIRVVPLAAAAEFAPWAAGSAALAEALRPWGLAPGYWLYVGTVEPRKGLDTLLTAYEALPAGARRPLVAVGQAGWAGAATFARLRETPGVRYLGYVPDPALPALMAGARAFVYPSFFEGFGLPVLEAMAMGVPVVTTDASSLPEVTGPEGALLVPPSDPGALAEALRALDEGDALAAGLGARGRARAGLFSWARTAEATVEAYQEARCARRAKLDLSSGRRR